MKSIIKAFAFVLLSVSAFAQPSELHQIFSNVTINTGTTNQIVTSGVTNKYGAPSSFAITSSNQIQDVSEFDNVGFTFAFKGLAKTTNGTVDLYFYKTFDNGAVYESTPSYSYSFAPTGAGNYTTNGNLSVAGATGVGVSFDNNTYGPATNVFLSFNPKAPKVLIRSAVD